MIDLVGENSSTFWVLFFSLEDDEMKVIFVRHGKTNSNIEKRYNRKEDSLNVEGREQVKKLREELKEMKFDAIFSSPLKRARETAEILVDDLQKIIFDQRLEERDVGKYQGELLSSMDREEYWHYPSTVHYETVETIESFFQRVYQFLDELKKKSYDRILVVAHSGVSKAF